MLVEGNEYLLMVNLKFGETVRIVIVPGTLGHRGEMLQQLTGGGLCGLQNQLLHKGAIRGFSTERFCVLTKIEGTQNISMLRLRYVTS